MLELISMTLGKILPVSITIFIAWVISLYAYRVTLHPLAKFPGPKIAAATRWYEFYYDIVLSGQMVFHLPELHKKYGPIVRISPEELHIDDPDFFDTLYVKSGRLHRYEKDSIRFGSPNNVFATVDSNLHKIRRSALNPFFSRRNVTSYQHVVRDKVNQMVSRIGTHRATSKPVNLSSAYMALAGDVIMDFCFGYNFDHLESKGFATNFQELMTTSVQAGALAVHFPIVMTILMSMPEWFVVWTTPLFALLFKMQKSIRSDVEASRRHDEPDDPKVDLTKPNVVRYLVQSDLPPQEKTNQRLQEEAQNFVGAGAATTGWVLSVISFHVIRNRSVMEKLRKELEEAITDPKDPACLEWNQLERCDYLTACIKEGHRLADPVSGRSPRVSDDVIQYGDWQIPPRTPVSMSVFDISHNENIFPDSKSFKPERWLDNPKTRNGEPLERYWVGFSKGNRMCLGINLAWLELYMATAGIFRNFDLELFETDESDATMKHDFMVGSPRLDSKGIRVLVIE